MFSDTAYDNVIEKINDEKKELEIKLKENLEDLELQGMIKGLEKALKIVLDCY